MTLKLTPELLRCAYEMLAVTPPFNKWNLPEADELKFKISRNPKEYGAVETDGRDIWFCASDKTVGRWLNLLATVAHELIHVHQLRTGLPLDHGPAFKKWAEQVCRHHKDFDPKNF